MEIRQQSSNSEISNSSSEYPPFAFSDSKTDLQNFDFESDLKKYLKIKATFLRSIVHDSGVRNDEEVDILTSIRDLAIVSEDDLEKPADEPIQDSHQEIQNVELDDCFSQSAIPHETPENEAPGHSQYDKNVSREVGPLSCQKVDDSVEFIEDLLPGGPINLHRKIFRWNRQRTKLEDNDRIFQEGESIPCEPSFTEVVMKAFIAGRLLFSSLRKRRKVLDGQRRKIADSLFKEDADSGLIAYVDPPSLAVDSRPMVPITANTLHKDRPIFNAAERPLASEESGIKPSACTGKNTTHTVNVGPKTYENSSQSKPQTAQPEANKTGFGSAQVGTKPSRRNKKTVSSSSDEDIEELERISEARLGKRK